MQAIIESKTYIEIDLEVAAQWFAHITDDDQAQFFCKVAKIIYGWDVSFPEDQFYYIGKHLKTCDCSTEEGRAMITKIYKAMTE